MSDQSEDNQSASDMPSSEDLAARLVRLLQVETLDTDLYRGPRNPGGQGRVFGGQVIGQALMAATGSIEDEKVAHSLHAYFMRPGDEQLPIIYRVERDHDGGSFATRRIIAIQNGKPILNMAASFQRPETGLSHQFDMPDAPDPDTLPTESEVVLRHRDRLPEPFVEFITRRRPIEVRHADEWTLASPRKGEPRPRLWFRAAGPLGDDPKMHRAVLSYASDMALMGACMQPHGVSWLTDRMQTASLDHAVWLHDDFRADEWLLYATDSPWSGGGRGFNRGQIFTRDGRLVASTAQEALIRLKE